VPENGAAPFSYDEAEGKDFPSRIKKQRMRKSIRILCLIDPRLVQKIRCRLL
jgi:hypothetical protein